jgi:hypothetical protein
MLATFALAALAAEAATFWAPAAPPRGQYEIDTEIDAEQRLIKGSETIRFVNTAL